MQTFSGKGANDHTQNFNAICTWVDEQIETQGSADLDKMKEKYIELTGTPSGAWVSLTIELKNA